MVYIEENEISIAGGLEERLKDAETQGVEIDGCHTDMWK